jgi:membrane-associated protease RseP (regulator of RpoE activity)
MDLYLISVIIFVAILAIIVWRDRKNFTRQAILLLRKTKRGKTFLTKIGQRWYGWFWIGNLAVIVCFLISIWIVWQLLYITIKNLTIEQVIPAAGFILPSPFATPSIGPGYFAIPFWYWIIAIVLLAFVHEGFHGIMAAREKIKIKSLGWGLFLIIPLAFVEPDEKQLVKKSAKTQLRVFAAGSFANFCLAALAFLLLSGFVYNFFSYSGVAFQSWIATKIDSSDVIAIDNISITELSTTNFSYLNQSRSLLELYTKNATYLIPPDMLLSQLNQSEWIVFEEWPAVKVNLTGKIVKIGNSMITNTNDLKNVLEQIGPNVTVSITTTNDTHNKTYTIVTAAEPVPQFIPDWTTYMILFFEHILPGTIDIGQTISKWWSSLWGEYREDWSSIQYEISFWKWVKQNDPKLAEKADKKIFELEKKCEKKTRSAFIGISNVYTVMEIKPEFVIFSGEIEFIQGLLFWLFLINFGVGAFNLLPIKALDGGRMWELLFQKINKKHAKDAINILSYIMLFLILLNFLAIFSSIKI